MQKAITETKQKFQSSCGHTVQYLNWFEVFKNGFTRFLKKNGVTGIKFEKPNHFDIFGFFRNGEQIYYFRIEDLRWAKDKMLIRTAKHYTDYSGGCNEFVSLNSVKEFEQDFNYVLGLNKKGGKNEC